MIAENRKLFFSCRQMEAITDRCEWHGQFDHG